MSPVRFGLFVPQGWILDLVDIEDPIEQYETMSRVAQTAERLGFDSIWLFDHFHTYNKPVLETTFECWTATAALARDTTRIRLGQMVTCNGYRNPALLAKMASTVDVLSHGRLDFGIGGGWFEHEYLAYGYPYPATPERLRMLGESLQVIKAMWTEPYASFDGAYYKVDGAINEPKGVQKAPPADLGRRQRREGDPQARGQVRRRHQLRRPLRRHVLVCAQAGRAAGPLRVDRAGPRDDHPLDECRDHSP